MPLIIMGLVLLVIGFAFRLLHWPDVLLGFYSGPIFIIVGFVLTFFRMRSACNEIPGKKQASSNLTLLYTHIIPFLGVPALIVYYFAIVKTNILLDFGVFLWGFLFICWLFLALIGINLFIVLYDDNGLQLIRNGSRRDIAFKHIKSISNPFLIVYQIEMKTGQNYLFIPHVLEFMADPFSDVSSVKTLKRRIEELGAPQR